MIKCKYKQYIHFLVCSWNHEHLRTLAKLKRSSWNHEYLGTLAKLKRSSWNHEYLGTLAKLKRSFTLQETRSIHDSMNIQKIELISQIKRQRTRIRHRLKSSGFVSFSIVNAYGFLAFNKHTCCRHNSSRNIHHLSCQTETKLSSVRTAAGSWGIVPSEVKIL